MSKTAYEILLEKCKNGEISREELDRQARRQDRWEIIKFFGVFFGGALLLVIFFNETGSGRALDALFVNLFDLVGTLFLGFVVIGCAISVVLGAARWLQGK